MDVFLFLVTAILSIAFYWIVQNVLCAKTESHGVPFPPGPWGLPVLGYLPYLGKRPDITLMNLGKQYGSLFSVKMGAHFGVVLNDWKAYKAALVDQGAVFSARPNLEVFDDVGGRKGILFTDGQVWRDQRRFALSRLRDFGFGKQSIEVKIKEEVDELCDIFRKSKTDGVDVKDALFIPVLNVIWTMVAGRKYDSKDKQCARFKEVVTRFVKLSGVQSTTLLPTWVTRLGLGKKSRAERASLVFELLALMQSEIDGHRKTLQRNSPRDFIDSYLTEMAEIKASGNERNSSFTDDQLKWVSNNFFLAGMETTTSTLSWAILYMMHNPHVQDKIHEEMDRVLGAARTPQMEDRNLLPYTHATLLEIQRIASIVPLSLIHRNTSSATVLDYHIPKNSLVIPNIYALDHDPNYWEDPDRFNPERFLNDKMEIIKHEHFVPFSAGPRQCLGEALAKMELFLFFSTLMYNFNFDKLPNEPMPPLETIYGITLAPLPYNTLPKPRF